MATEAMGVVTFKADDFVTVGWRQAMPLAVVVNPTMQICGHCKIENEKLSEPSPLCVSPIARRLATRQHRCRTCQMQPL